MESVASTSKILPLSENKPVDSVFKQGNRERGRKSADCAEIGDAVWHTPFLLSRIAYSFLLAPRIRFTFCSLNFSRNYTILVKVRPHETFGSERVKKTGGEIELRKREVSEEERARKKSKEIERRKKKGERKKNR